MPGTCAARQQQVAELVSDRAREHGGGRHGIPRRLGLDAAIKHIRDRRVLGGPDGRSHHRHRTAVERAAFIREQHDAYVQTIAARRLLARRPFNVDADITIQAGDFHLRRPDDRRGNVGDVRQLYDDSERDRGEHAIDCGEARSAWELRER